MDLVGQDGHREQGGHRESDRESASNASPAQLATDVPAVSFSRLALFLTLGFVGCAIDLFTKHLAFSRVGSPPSPVYWIWEGFFGFQTSVNHGALFGMGQGNVTMFAVVSVVALIGLCIWIFRGGALSNLGLTIALGMILGGILGNLHDRLGLWGHAGVRDWILWCYKGWVWPNFNIADSLLVCGAILMMWQSWREEIARSRIEKQSAQSPAKSAHKATK